MAAERIIAYIDGYNLYHGLREKGWKWAYCDGRTTTVSQQARRGRTSAGTVVKDAQSGGQWLSVHRPEHAFEVSFPRPAPQTGWICPPASGRVALIGT
jgi:hypothetical protein